MCVLTHFSILMEYGNSRVTPNANHRLWVIMTSQGRFSDYNNESTSLLGAVDKGGGWAWSAVVLLVAHRVRLCDPMDCSPPDSSVHRILQVRVLEWVAIPFSRGSSHFRGQSWVSCITGGFFTN